VALLESLSSPERVPISGGIFYTPHHTIEHTRSKVTTKVVFAISQFAIRYSAVIGNGFPIADLSLDSSGQQIYQIVTFNIL
jgi:hypothetical protein